LVLRPLIQAVISLMIDENKPTTDVSTRKPVSGIDIYELYDRMNMNNILLSFKGDITAELMSSILQIMEQRLDTFQEAPRTRKKVYNVMVECLQNLYHHVDAVPINLGEKEDSDRSAIFMIGLDDKGYRIITGNYVQTDRADDLKTNLEDINSREPEGLRELYKEILNNDQRSGKGGSGLGMVDIARKTGQKLAYDFTPINNEHTFFTLNINVEQ
jgi:hypothetical protein